MTRVLFWTGGGPQTGFGHVRRCLTLALALRAAGSDSIFIVEGGPLVAAPVQQAGFETLSLPESAEAVTRAARERGAEVVVADSYAITPADFRELAEQFRVLAMDDLADREMPVDVILNPALAADQLDYSARPDTRYLLGPRFSLLRAEFALDPARTIAPQVSRILITAGGSDPYQLTPRLMEWTAAALPEVVMEVVVGPLFERAPELQRLASGRVRLHFDPIDMRALMLSADLAITGGGQTTYELAAAALPALAVAMADNQRLNLAGLAAAGALRCVGRADDPGLAEALAGELHALAANPDERAAMGARGRALVDGRGAERVAQAVLEMGMRK